MPELDGIEIILDVKASGNSAFNKYKSTTMSVNLVPNQTDYFLKAILYTDQDLNPDIEEEN